MKAVKYIKDGENRISFIKDIEITDGKVYMIYSTLSNEMEKFHGIWKFKWVWKWWIKWLGIKNLPQN